MNHYNVSGICLFSFVLFVFMVYHYIGSFPTVLCFRCCDLLISLFGLFVCLIIVCLLVCLFGFFFGGGGGVGGFGGLLLLLLLSV